MLPSHLNAGARRAAAVCLFVLAFATSARAQTVAYTGGLQFATGDYLFPERTQSIYVLSGLDASAGAVRLTASLPLIVQSTPWVTYGPAKLPTGGRQMSGSSGGGTGNGGGTGGGGGGGGGSGPGGGSGSSQSLAQTSQDQFVATTGTDAQAGIGDPLVRVDLELIGGRSRSPAVTVATSVKAPVASVSSGFSTGEWDVGAGSSVAKTFGRNSIVADVMFWHFGDSDALELQDALSIGLSYGRVLGGGRWAVLMSGSGFTRVIEGQTPPVQLGVGLNRLFSSQRSLAAGIFVGLTGTAADVAAGVSWRVGLNN